MEETNIYSQEGDITHLLIINKKLEKFNILIDTENAKRIKKYSWHVGKGSKGAEYFHVRAYIERKDGKDVKKLLSRVIMEVQDESKVVDHINGDTFDNRKDNLRIVTPFENSQNRNKLNSNNISGVPNVYWREKSKKWVAQIGRKHIGHFNTKEEAKNVIDSIKPIVYPYSSTVDSQAETDESILANIYSKSRLKSTNTSGMKGVCWDKQRQKWLVQITRDKKKIFFKRYLSFSDAVEAANSFYSKLKEGKNGNDRD